MSTLPRVLLDSPPLLFSLLMTVQGLMYPEGNFELGLSEGTNTVGKFHKLLALETGGMKFS